MNSHKPMVSIVVAAYNAETWISDCITSVVNQSSDAWELIVVDDGSTDQTNRIIDGFLGDNRIHKINCEHRGLAASRNTGLSLCTGEFLALLDADDYIRPNFVECVLDKMIGEDLDLIYFSSFVFSEDEKMADRVEHLANYSKRPVQSFKKGPGRDIFIWLDSINKFVMTGCLQVVSAGLMRKAFASSPVFQEGTIYEDNPYSLKLAIMSNQTGVIADELYCRRVHSHSITATENIDEQRVLLNIKSYKYCLQSCAKLMCMYSQDTELFDTLAGFYSWYAENISTYAGMLQEEDAILKDEILITDVTQLLVSRIKDLNTQLTELSVKKPTKRKLFNIFKLGD